jgi:hypothetical protein
MSPELMNLLFSLSRLADEETSKQKDKENSNLCASGHTSRMCPPRANLRAEAAPTREALFLQQI